jgi:hypothetical protein
MEEGTASGGNAVHYAQITVLDGDNTGNGCIITRLSGDNHGHGCTIGFCKGTNKGSACTVIKQNEKNKNKSKSKRKRAVTFAEHEPAIAVSVDQQDRYSSSSSTASTYSTPSQVHDTDFAESSLTLEKEEESVFGVFVNGGHCLICEEPAPFTLLCTKIDKQGNKIRTVCDLAYCEEHVKAFKKCPQCETEKFWGWWVGGVDSMPVSC